MRNWTIKGNSLGLDWDANRGGQGPNYGWVQGRPAPGWQHAGTLLCWPADCGHLVWNLLHLGLLQIYYAFILP